MTTFTDERVDGADGDLTATGGDHATAGVDHATADGDTAADVVRQSAPMTPWLERVGRRIIRRPVRWIESEWTNERIVRYITALVIVGGSTFAVIKGVRPGLVFTNNTATGGDMGAQVMAPAYLRDSLLPNFQLSGWSNDWYAGMPFYRFYMVVPGLMVVLLNLIFPYGIAFKIVVVAGLVTLPFCCWCFGRLADLRYPTPELLALAGLLFVWDNNFTILGGNMTSTMAGEFSFSIALSFAVLGLGVFARGLRTGQYRSWAAILIAMAALCHGIVLLFVFGAALLLWLIWLDATRLKYGFQVLGAAVLLSAFWVLPFLLNHEYMTDMKYAPEPENSYRSWWEMFFPGSTVGEAFIVVFAVFGFVSSIARRHLTGAWLGVTTLVLVIGTYLAEDSLPLIGLLWNPRVLPFYYLCRLFLMMIGLVEFGYLVAAHIGVLRRSAQGQLIAGACIAAVIGVGATGTLITMFKQPTWVSKFDDGKFEWFGIPMSSASDVSRGPAWAKWNFTGYEGTGDSSRNHKPYYGEYYDLVTRMGQLGDERGCGRALWENNEANGSYGTTMGLMLLPHWTDGCISSMEGLYFEASGTTPYHFVTAAAVSTSSSNPVRELRYDNSDTAKGVPYMQSLGVRYLMVLTLEAKVDAAQQPELTLLDTVGPWEIYEVADSQLVEGLAYQPVVVNDRDGDQREHNLEMGMSWFQNRDEWAAMPANDGPASWQRIDVASDPARDDGKDVLESGRRIDVVVPQQPIEAVPLPKVEVSNIELGEQDLSFTVDQIGVPVLVKMSYFPNWKVEGADGPYRIGPNMMVVIPTSNEVRLEYGRTTLDYLAYLLTVGGIALLVFFRRRGDVRHRTMNPVLGNAPYGADGFSFGADLFGPQPVVAPSAPPPPPFWAGDPAAAPLGAWAPAPPDPNVPAGTPWPTRGDQPPQLHGEAAADEFAVEQAMPPLDGDVEPPR